MYISALKSDLVNAATAEEAYFADNDTYTLDVSELNKQGYLQISDVQIKIFPGEGGLKKDYIMIARHLRGEYAYIFNTLDLASTISNAIKEISNEEFEGLLSQSTYPFEKDGFPDKAPTRRQR